MLKNRLQWLLFLALLVTSMSGLNACTSSKFKAPGDEKSSEDQLAELEALSKGEAPADPKLPGKEKPAPFKVSDLRTTSTFLQYIDHVVGTGVSPEIGDTVEVHYTGWLTDGTVFDSSMKRGEPASFELGKVIKGWNQGLRSMKVGGKRLLVIPADLGYGEHGTKTGIPPKAMLVFEVSLLKVTPKK